MGNVSRTAPFGHRNVPLSLVGGYPQEQVGRSLPDVLSVNALGRSRTQQVGWPLVRAQLLARFIEADEREARITGTRIQIEHGLHGRGKGGILRRRDHPARTSPRFEVVFLSVVRTVSAQMPGVISSTTACSARSFRL